MQFQKSSSFFLVRDTESRSFLLGLPRIPFSGVLISEITITDSVSHFKNSLRGTKMHNGREI